MRARGQTRQPITGQEWLLVCSAARLNLDINAFKISENCIPCDFLTFQKSTLLFLSAPDFESKPAVLNFVSLKEFLWTRVSDSMLGFDSLWVGRRVGAGTGPRHRRHATKYFKSGLESTPGHALISWWQISQNCDPKICRHPPSWIFLIRDPGTRSCLGDHLEGIW